MDHVGKEMWYSCIPLRPATVGVMSTWRPRCQRQAASRISGSAVGDNDGLSLGKGQSHSALNAHMENDVDFLISEEAQQDMDLKSAIAPAVPRQPFFRAILGDAKHRRSSRRPESPQNSCAAIQVCSANCSITAKASAKRTLNRPQRLSAECH